ncbi:polysaccharide deacetylase family protein [Myceligenerans sp. I2]|uniref:Polysaccharide deacetylase family protein n=1 Tax=Myceligenerans indicum TaxID=2593663 RepID=A0ABS1LEZ2_9MICO|nr:polysaccharide deacetylase family protein [Myceligenerans indicum]
MSFTRKRGRLARTTRAAWTAGAALLVGLTGVAAAPAAQAADCSAGYVALTFDDGPNGGTSSQLVNILGQYGATATMFPTGQNAQSNPSLMQAYAAAGLQIGNHSWDHPYLTQLSQSQIQQQLANTSSAIQQTAGVTPDLFRPPYGDTNWTVQQVASSLGMTQIIWDVDSQDYNGVSSSQIRSAAAGLTNGQIILMHDWPQNTVQALPGILQDLAGRDLCTGHISPATGRAVAPDGGQQPPGGGDGTCTVTVTRAEEWGDRFNTTFSVSGTNAWRVTITTGSGQTLQNSWNATISGTSGTLTATPNGNGNAFGITLYSNGNRTSPTATCSTS